MVIEDLKRFEELANSCGNKYLAVRFISQWARESGIEYKEYGISESKLIEWVISGKCPYTRDQMICRKTVNELDDIDDILEWVDDSKIEAEVRSLYSKSVRKHHIVECNNLTFSKSQISRVNILLRMVWFSI